ncbi:hypothetical protein LCGC14_0405170 [marine sediment metagenome]|uniref:Uncharacterized protein n=1 Tax=marine sediment metagenome TaxID=412755 RepID=A0A0F9W4J5_9ZZZZ
MSTNTLVTKAPGNKIISDDVNQYKDAFVEDITCRNSLGVSAPGEGDLGTEGGEFQNLRILGNIIRKGEVLDLTNFQSLNHQIQAGKATLDGFPDFLEVVASSTNINIKAGGANPNLELVINKETVILESDILVTGLLTAPAANNTALVSDAAYANQKFTETEGEFGSTFINYDTAGLEITGLDGTIQAFQHGAGPEFFLALIDNTNSRLYAFKRGIGGSEREEMANNDVITLLRTSYIFLDADLTTVFAPTRPPEFQSFDPGSPSLGDIYFNTDSKRWQRFNGSLFENKDIHFIGIAIVDDTQVVAVEANDFDLAWASNLDLDAFFVDDDTVRINAKDVSVAGQLFTMENHFGREIQLSVDLESGVSETANTLYYIYVDSDLNYFFSDKPPRLPDKKEGYYHPFRYWRWTGVTVFNDGASNILKFDYQKGQYHYHNAQESTGLSTSLTLNDFNTIPAPINNWICRFVATAQNPNIQEVFFVIRAFTATSGMLVYAVQSTSGFTQETGISANMLIQNGTILALKSMVSEAFLAAVGYDYRQ